MAELVDGLWWKIDGIPDSGGTVFLEICLCQCLLWICKVSLERLIQTVCWTVQDWTMSLQTDTFYACLSVCLPACLSVCLSLHSSIPMYLQFMHLWSYVGIELCRYVEIMIYTYMVRAGSPAPPMLPLPSNPRHNKASLHASHTYDLLTFMPVTQYL